MAVEALKSPRGRSWPVPESCGHQKPFRSSVIQICCNFYPAFPVNTLACNSRVYIFIFVLSSSIQTQPISMMPKMPEEVSHHERWDSENWLRHSPKKGLILELAAGASTAPTRIVSLVGESQLWIGLANTFSICLPAFCGKDLNAITISLSLPLSLSLLLPLHSPL